MISSWCGAAGSRRSILFRVGLLIALLAAPLTAQRPSGRYIYEEFDGVYAFYRPRELRTYRELLPDVFDMPDTPLVQAFIADYYKMDAATQPYREAAIFLLAKYEGQRAWHCISMPVTSDEARRLGVLFLGYPKVMGDVTLQRTPSSYIGTLVLDGRPTMSIALTTAGHTVTQEEKQWFQDLAGIRSLNILNGRVIDPIPGRQRRPMSLLDVSRMFPEYIEIKMGKAEISLKPPATGEGSQKSADPFGIEPAEIVLAYYLKNKLGFSFGRRRGLRDGAE